MRIRNDTDEDIVIPAGESVDVFGETETHRSLVQRTSHVVIRGLKETATA